MSCTLTITRNTKHESINDQRACQQPQSLQYTKKEINPTANKVQNG